MKPVVIDGWCTLYHADNAEIVDVLREHEPDAVITDPPYGIVNKFGTNVGNGTRTMQFEWDRGGEVTVDVVATLGSVFQFANAFHTFCGPEQYGRIADVSRLAGFTPKPWAWVKECHPPAGKGNWWPSGFELAMYGYRPGAWFGDTDKKRSNIYRSDTYRHGIRKYDRTEHPTQKWLPMISHIVSSIVPPEGMALDPFMGSGTTAVAAFLNGRKFVGVEIDRRWFDVAVERIKRQTCDGPLFETRQEPEQVALLA